MLCSRCKKRPAMVFISVDKEDSKPQGFCLTCAKELGLKPLDDIMNKIGFSAEEMESMAEQMNEFMNLSEDELASYEDFVEESAAALPFIKNVFSSSSSPNNSREGSASGTTSGRDSSKKKKANNKKKYLELYCSNLTEKARKNKLDKIIGRDKEIARTIQILSRRTKNNPCLIGEPGVGKTAIAESLAILISKGKVPTRLKKKEIYLIDLTALVAGTQFRGQFENRIKGLIDEVKEAGNIILFIDEVHNLVGAGETESNSMNAGNILKPALSRGEIQVIGATTFSEYRKYIEKDAALERRFQPISIVEPSIDSTVDVLKGIKAYYEKYHRINISDDLIRKIVVLSERYIMDRFLPDKAIDLMDESAAFASLKNLAMEKYDSLSRQLDGFIATECEIASREPDNVDYEKLAKVRSEIARINQELEKIAEKAFSVYVTESDVAHVVELWTGIPSSKIKENDLKKLANIEDKLKSKVIGQDEAVEAVASAIKRSRVQISPRRRPASFIFVGPTGVGKTELVKVLSKELFDSPETLIRLDMSEFMEKHSVSRIIGSPPGYVGYSESGQITEKVRRRPYSVLLFDEIEKAHPDVLNILLQILDEGKITDAQGRQVNFENTIIVMTSNAGSDKKSSAVGFAKTQNELNKEKAHKALSDFLRPEFLSRIDEIIVFRDLDKSDFEKIAKLMLDEYVGILAERNITLSYNDSVLKWLADKAFGGKNAARDLRNLIRKNVEDKIALELIENYKKMVTEIAFCVNKSHLEVETV